LWGFFLLLLAVNIYYPVSPEGWVLRSQIKTCPQSQLRIVQEKESPASTPGLGTQEIPRADGGKDTIYYSTVTPEEEKKTQQEEKEKEEKSWDVLRNIINHSKQPR
jgi:hypothetical protein